MISDIIAAAAQSRTMAGPTFGPGEYVMCDNMCDPRTDAVLMSNQSPRIRHGGESHYHGTGALDGAAFMLHTGAAHLVPLAEYEAATSKHGPSRKHVADAQRGLSRNHGAHFVVKESLRFEHHPISPWGSDFIISGVIDGVPFAFRGETRDEFNIRFETDYLGKFDRSTTTVETKAHVVVSRETALGQMS